MLILRRFMSAISCELIESVNRHSPIPLPHSTPVTLGRGRETLVTDKRCSRVQLEITADYEALEVSVRHRGTHPSRVAGQLLADGSEVTIGNGSFFCLLEDKFKYNVFFRFNNSLEDKNSNKDVSSNNNDIEVSGKPVAKRSRLDEFFLKPCDPSTSKSLSPGKWSRYESIVSYLVPLVHGRIAAFDLDGTLIATRSGNVFPKNIYDWRPLYSQVKSKLQTLSSKDGYDILIMSNQMGVSAGKITIADMQEKFDSILAHFEVPASIIFATKKDIYRKPAPGMWSYFRSNLTGDVALDLSDSFYCGDAAGRPENKVTGKKKDFSDSDLKFAHNISLTFYTPEEVFLGEDPPPLSFGPKFNPFELRDRIRLDKIDLLSPKEAKLSSDKQELIILVGCQASGKSSFYREHLATKGYTQVSQDLLRSKEKCLSLTDQLLKAGKSVVIDNTNPDTTSRSGYIQIAKKSSVPVRVFWLQTDREHCRHNNMFRRLTDYSKSHGGVDDRVINIYMNKFEEPNLEEGIEEIVEVNCIPRFQKKQEEDLYFKFLV